MKNLQQLTPNYLIYPSLLDKFQSHLDIEKDFESFWNIDSEGNYKKTLAEIEEQSFQELIDSINRVPFESEAADKGTAFNEIVDCLIANRKSEMMTLVSDRNSDTITVQFKEWTFIFSLSFCLQAAEYFKGAVSQVFVKANIETRYGIVNLYGYLDEVIRSVVYDIKTTSKYDFGKYSKGWQKHVYPYCLIESGEMDEVTMFEYSAFQLSKPSGRNPVISGKFYPEQYNYNHKQSTDMIRQHCERFIEFLEKNRHLITNKRIFNQLEAVGA